MKNQFTGYRIIGVFALVVLITGCAHTGQTENLLLSSGFTVISATTTQQQQHLKTLPPHRVTQARRDGKIYYVYADPAHNQIYVGTQFQYYKYRDMRLIKNLSVENVQSADLTDDMEIGWDVWGPWYFQNH